MSTVSIGRINVFSFRLADSPVDNPDGSQCFDLSPGDLVSWISDFSSAYEQSTGRYVTMLAPMLNPSFFCPGFPVRVPHTNPTLDLILLFLVIKTTIDWWNTCTNENTDFSDSPLWIGDFSGDLPAGLRSVVSNYRTHLDS